MSLGFAEPTSSPADPTVALWTSVKRKMFGKKIKVSKASKSTTEIQKPIKVTPSNKAVLSDDDNSVRIKSPIIGTAYLAPEPGGKKFIEVGDKIKKGQTVMIVEAMKTMNHIPSTNDGVVKEVLVKDGQPVEFGQSLVLLK